MPSAPTLAVAVVRFWSTLRWIFFSRSSKYESTMDSDDMSTTVESHRYCSGDLLNSDPEKKEQENKIDHLRMCLTGKTIQLSKDGVFNELDTSSYYSIPAIEDVCNSSFTDCLSDTPYISLIEDSSTSRLIWPVLLLGVLNVFTDTLLGSSIVPILPRELDLDEMRQGVVLAIGAVAASFLGPFCGWLSDVKGWYSSLIWFYPLVTLSSCLMLHANRSFWRFVIARFIAGVGSAFMYPSNLSMVVTTHEPSIRATAVGLTLAGDIGSLCGPVFGGMLYDAGGSRLLFRILVCICLITSIIFLLLYGTIPFQPVKPPINSRNQYSSYNLNCTMLTSSPSIPDKLSVVHNTHITQIESEVSNTPVYKSNLQQSLLQTSFHAFQPPATTPIIETACCSQNESSLKISLPQKVPSHVKLKKKCSCPISCHLSDSSSELIEHVPHPLKILNTSIYETDSLSSSTVISPKVWTRLYVGLQDMHVFFTLPFTVRFFSLFYCWGVAINFQVILPFVWNRDLGLAPSTIGLLFSPHLILRVASCGLSTFLSDLTSTPLKHFISFGLFLSVSSVCLVAIFPSASLAPDVGCLALLGMGLGICDSCITAWAGTLKSPTHINPSTDVLHGRAFAIMGLACDSGMFLVPIIGTGLAEFLSYRAAYIVLGGCGIFMLCLSIYCGAQEESSSCSSSSSSFEQN